MPRPSVITQALEIGKFKSLSQILYADYADLEPKFPHIPVPVFKCVKFPIGTLCVRGPTAMHARSPREITREVMREIYIPQNIR